MPKLMNDPDLWITCSNTFHKHEAAVEKPVLDVEDNVTSDQCDSSSATRSQCYIPIIGKILVENALLCVSASIAQIRSFH